MPAGAPGAKHVDPGHFRQAEIEHGGVVALGCAAVLTVFAVAGDVDDAALGAQECGDPAGELTIIFDKQDAHGRTLGRSRRARLGQAP